MKRKPEKEEELRVINGDIYDYEIEFDGENPVDVDDLRAAIIIKGVLTALDVDFKEITCKRITTHTYSVSKEKVTVEFVGDVPEYWYTEFDVEAKAVEIAMNGHRMRIPMVTLLRWFEEAKDKGDMK